MRELIDIIAIFASIGCLLVGAYEGFYKSDYLKGTFYIALAILNKLTLLHY